MAQTVLIWTCILVFISTSIITLLGIINRVSIERYYLNKLFLALILEIVAIGVLTFKNSFNLANCKSNFAKITTPSNGFEYDTEQNSSLFIDGAYIKEEESLLAAELLLSDKNLQLYNASKADNIFKYIVSNNELANNSKATVKVTINKNGEILYRDSLRLTIK